MPESVTCPCGSDDPPSQIIEAVDEVTKEAFTYLVCPACSLERLSPRPTIAEIGAYYPQRYLPHSGAATFGPADQLKRLVYWAFWAPQSEVPKHIRRVRPFLRLGLWPVRHRSILSFPQPRARRVFEFGAAKATDLLAFRAAGWEVAGCEPSAQACALAAEQGITLQQATAETADLEDGSYSCILLNNVLEHVHEPRAVLKKCRRALMPGGILMLIGPNHASATRHAFGAAWPGYDAPRHTFGWTPAAIQLFLVSEGFSVEGIHQQTTGAWMWRSTLDMRHAPGEPGPVRRWVGRHAPHLMLPWSVMAAMLGRGDWMRVVAQKT
jgi:SAM-dependent methyltransferase